MQPKPSGKEILHPTTPDILNLSSCLHAGKGSGHPLPAADRSFMEGRFNVDFGRVRIHTGQPAEEMNSRLRAQAFTHGRDIYFGAGKYSSGSPSTRRLLAHELTHVVQQTGAPGSVRKGAISLHTPSEGALVQREVSREECTSIDNPHGIWVLDVHSALNDLVGRSVDPDEPGYQDLVSKTINVCRSAERIYGCMHLFNMTTGIQHIVGKVVKNLRTALEVMNRDDPNYRRFLERAAFKASRATYHPDFPGRFG